MASISFDRAADFYDATRGYPEATAEAIASALCVIGGIRPGSDVLELGIGTGRIALPLLARGVNITGVDIAARMLERLQANLAVRQSGSAGSSQPWGALAVRVADITALPFPDESFDAVIAVHVLHLVEGWRRALEEALRVLRPDGALLLGQDRHPDALSHDVWTQWMTILSELGADASAVGNIGGGGEQVIETLRARGLTVTTTSPVNWTTASSPRDAVRYLALRQPSRTWRVPDDIFAASIARLETWALGQYGATYDQPVPEPAQFAVTCARRVAQP